MDYADTDGRFDRTLKQLRPPRAPLTLLPRVLAAVHAWAERPWYERAWFTWPIGWQVAAIAALILLGVGGAILLPIGLRTVSGATAAPVADVSTSLAAIAQRTSMIAEIVRLVGRSIFIPVLAYAFMLVMLMALVCGTLALALNRVVFGRPVHS